MADASAAPAESKAGEMDLTHVTAIDALNIQVTINDRAASGDPVPAVGVPAGAVVRPPTGATKGVLKMLSMPAPPRMAAQSIVMNMLEEGLAGQPTAFGAEEDAPAEAEGATAAGDAAGATDTGAGQGAGAGAAADMDPLEATTATQTAAAGPGGADDDAKSEGTTGSIVDDIVTQAGVSPACTLVWYFARRKFGCLEKFLEVACRPLSILRPGKDLLALPIGFPVVMDLWMWAVERFGYQLWQAMWYPAPLTYDEAGNANLDVDFVHKKVVDSVSTMFRGRLTEVLLIPFQKAKPLHALCASANIRTFGDTFDGLTIKDCLHPRPWDGAETVPTSFLKHPKTGEETGIHVPRGFTCITKEELVAAYAAMKNAGVEKVVLKPSWSSSGSGIKMDVKEADVAKYKWDTSKGSIVLEEFLAVDVDPTDGRARWPVVHFLARSRCGEVVEQLIAGTTSYNGTVSPCDINTAVSTRVQEVAGELADVFGFSGFWGIDLLVHKNEPYLIDLNSGRPNGGHVPKIFVSLHAPNQPFKFWKEKHVSGQLTAKKMHSAILKAGLGFTSESKRGMIILHVFPGVIATVMAIGTSKKDLAKLLEEWDVHRADILMEEPGAPAH